MVVGDFLTEINITCPTGMRQIKQYADYDVVSDLFDAIEEQLTDG